MFWAGGRLARALGPTADGRRGRSARVCRIAKTRRVEGDAPTTRRLAVANGDGASAVDKVGPQLGESA